MTAEEKQLLESVNTKLDLLLGAIAVQQKDAVEIAGVSKDTPRNAYLSGDLEILSRDGSRLNYITLESVGDLKKRSRRKKT